MSRVRSGVGAHLDETLSIMDHRAVALPMLDRAAPPVEKGMVNAHTLRMDIRRPRGLAWHLHRQDA